MLEGVAPQIQTDGGLIDPGEAQVDVAAEVGVDCRGRHRLHLIRKRVEPRLEFGQHPAALRYLDNSSKLYNLDHHEGCERAFTLATCEQALLMVYSGVELSVS